MPESSPEELALMRKAADENPPAAEDRLTAEEIFLGELARRVGDWFDMNEKYFSDDPPTPRLFILSDSTPFNDSIKWELAGSHRSLIAADCLDEGSVFICDMQCNTAQVIQKSFSTTGDIVDFAKTIEIEDRAFVILLAKQNIMAIHQPGDPLELLTNYRINPYDTTPLALSDIEDAFRDMHKHGTSTHQGDCHVWVNVENLEMVREAEKTIQGFVFNGLRCLFRSRQFLLDKEVTTYKGREDIRIYWLSTLHNVPDIGLVVEMKVLRPKHTDGKNIKWIKKGIQQAHDYAETDDRLTTKWVACYDARKSPTSFPDDVYELADSHTVEIQQYVMSTQLH